MRRILVAGGVVAATSALIACGSSPGENTITVHTPTETAAVAPIDACSLISPQDISALLGTPIEGVSTTTDPSLAGCLWENPDNYESVSLQIGNPRTAVNGTLAPAEPGFPEVGTPGPDGMRFLGNGMVEFPAGGRSNVVQVAVLSMLGEQADNAAVELARKVGPLLPN
jgi:hypothetical protein